MYKSMEGTWEKGCIKGSGRGGCIRYKGCMDGWVGMRRGDVCINGRGENVRGDVYGKGGNK